MVRPGYARQVRRWHRRAPRGRVRSWQALDPRPLVLRPIRYRGLYELLPDEAGRFTPYQMTAARKAFTYRGGLAHDVHPRLMELVYRAVLEFNAPYVWVISGYP